MANPENKNAGLKEKLGGIFQKQLEEWRNFRLRKALQRRYEAFGKNPSMENFCDLVEKLVENGRHKEAQSLAEIMLKNETRQRKRLPR